MIVIETQRLLLKKLENSDAIFIKKLVNDPDWIRFIGERNIHTEDDARAYLEKGPLKSYALNGFGLYKVSTRVQNIAVGICGLIKRDELDDVDIGYALLRDFRGKGYAIEAARAVLKFGHQKLGLRRIVAITTADNERSGRLLAKAGLHFEKMIKLNDDQTENKLFAIEFGS